MRGKPGSGYEGDLEISLRLCPMPSLTEEDRDVTFWSDLLSPLGRGPLMRQFRRRGRRLWKGRRSTRRWMKQWKERKLKVTPSTLWFLTPKYVNLIPTKMQNNVFSPTVLSTLLHASNYFLAVPKMIDGKLANFFINRFELSIRSRFCSSQPFSILWKVEYPYLPLFSVGLIVHIYYIYNSLNVLMSNFPNWI